MGSINYIAFSVIVVTDLTYVDLVRGQNTAVTITNSINRITLTGPVYYAATTSYFCLFEWVTAVSTSLTYPTTSYYDTCTVNPRGERYTSYDLILYTKMQVWMTGFSVNIFFIKSSVPNVTPTFNILK